MSKPTHRSRASRLRRGNPVWVLAVAVLLMGAAAGCSDDDGGSAASTTSGAGQSEGAGSGDDEESTPEPGGAGADLPELTEVEQSYVDAILDNLGGDPTPILPGADNECLAVVWVDVIGGEKLEASGLSPDEFAAQGPPSVGIDRPTAEAMVEAMVPCGASPERFYEEWAAVIGLQPGSETLECMEDAVSVDVFRDALVATFMGEESDDLSDVQARFEECAPTAG